MENKHIMWYSAMVAILIALITLAISMAWVGGVPDGKDKYEEFYSMYNTCQKLDADIGVTIAIPDSDATFSQFSKAQRVGMLKMQLNRWINEYNAKSRMSSRSLWKSTTLPYQLDSNDFKNL